MNRCVASLSKRSCPIAEALRWWVVWGLYPWSSTACAWWREAADEAEAFARRAA